MSTFNFDDDSLAEIKDSDGGIIVSVEASDGGTIEISGFPTEKDAESFVMFGDFENPNDNDFINLTKPSFNLKWKFE